MGNKETAEAFEKLLEIADRLLGPEGCPWDREQTLVSMRESILEEACEVIEAIDSGKDGDLIEELGDLLYNVVFFGKLAEKESRFETLDPVRRIGEKLVFRHPHVFGEKKLHDAAAALNQWEEIKKREKSERESLMDGIPKGLPALARAYKIARKSERLNFQDEDIGLDFETEEELAHLLWSLTCLSAKKKINPEVTLRKLLVQKEKDFREWEKVNEKPSSFGRKKANGKSQISNRDKKQR